MSVTRTRTRGEWIQRLLARYQFRSLGWDPRFGYRAVGVMWIDCGLSLYAWTRGWRCEAMLRWSPMDQTADAPRPWRLRWNWRMWGVLFERMLPDTLAHVSWWILTIGPCRLVRTYSQYAGDATPCL